MNTVQMNCEISRPCEKYKIYDSTLTYNRERHFSTAKIRELDELEFHSISDETLNVMMEYFEELGDMGYFDDDYDIEYSDGVLTVKLGGNKGTYVINKQTPNRQIWLSSPTSGPKRYDFTESDGWIYRHNGISLHELLTEEISDVIGQSVSFTDLQYGGGTKI
ncbi:frataxin, mitochondrial-like [Dendronephthya gigantea]|uniref:frataxin, mitochondrial-like n=1 Tax=Dendronephthya gigantea TaxID=151771 RepID=UPI00106CCDD2|nr:frataxin, mitochondrial-like [Dendronephthya gigantea]